MKSHFWTLIFFAAFLWACDSKTPSLFSEVSAKSGILFNNELTYTEELNPYTYRNFYNGGGVALGDINNDWLTDIYFTGNLVDNKLFLNKGNWQFEDITTSAGVSCPDVWSTGATFVDINQDGWLDIYVCKSGAPGTPNRNNELFINQGDGTFIEESEKYGLNYTGLSTHAAFFDYDKDGDLDCYLLTNSFRSVGVGQDVIEGLRNQPSADNAGNKFLLNDNGTFKDITLEAGIYTSDIGYGLGITLGDFNNDSWTDIFISNDFFERDYLYINNQEGGFSEEAEKYFSSLSMGSMGADAEDLNNDGKPDIMVTEMLPPETKRRRTKAIFESWDKYSLGVSRGYHHQFPRNVLQRNVGDGSFLEVGRFAGTSATEWSWGTLVFDMNNDGLKDIFVSNGIYKDLLDRDYLTYMANDQQVRTLIQNEQDAITKLVDIMPSEAVPNAAYENQGDFNFENKAANWGLNENSFSNGSAYADLDNDGDLDLVVNNVNMPSFVYRNEGDTSANRGIRLKLEGSKNTFGIGAKVEAWANGSPITAQNFPSKGFQSSVDPTVHLGLGNIATIDSLIVTWSSGGVSKMTNVETNRLYTVKESSKSRDTNEQYDDKNSVLVPSSITANFSHKENEFVDFDRERLLFQMYHNEGPGFAIGDIDGDAHLDLFVGGAKEESATLLSGNQAGWKTNTGQFETDKISEDVSAEFFDADSDGDLDLYVASGGRAFSKESSALMDRLYMNDGQGNFEKSSGRLPFTTFFSSSIVKASDYDQDGDIDLFVAERFHPFFYGRGGRGFILENDGKGYFQDVTTSQAPSLIEAGMITSAAWADVNGDGREDLVTAGDWLSIQVYFNNSSGFDEPQAIRSSRGWWHTLKMEDIDEDGDLDLIAGNHGENSFFKSGTRMYRADFDQNGSPEQIICEERNGKYYPILDRDELLMQLPHLKKSILFYKDYAEKSIEDLFPKEVLQRAEVFEVDQLKTSLYINENGKFSESILPPEAQYSPVYAIETDDLDGDGYIDIILGGNQFLVKPQFGRFDGSKGMILRGSKNGYLSSNVDFMNIEGQIRGIRKLKKDGKTLILFVLNNGPLEVYEKREN